MTENNVQLKKRKSPFFRWIGDTGHFFTPFAAASPNSAQAQPQEQEGKPAVMSVVFIIVRGFPPYTPPIYPVL